MVFVAEMERVNDVVEVEDCDIATVNSSGRSAAAAAAVAVAVRKDRILLCKYI